MAKPYLYKFKCIDCGKMVWTNYLSLNPNRVLCSYCKDKRKRTTICFLCGERFEVDSPSAKNKTKYCNSCNAFLRSNSNYNCIIQSIRIMYGRLLEINPVKAQKFADEMEVLEGKEFKEKVLGNNTRAYVRI